MPNYNYECKSCGSIFDEFRAVSARHDPLSCIYCEGEAGLVILEAPSLDMGKMGCDSGFPTAWARWEKDHVKRAQPKD